MGQSKQQKNVESLRSDLVSENPEVRAEAANGLGKQKDSASFELLLQTLSDANEWVRLKAAQALGDLGDKRAIEPLLQALEDDDWEVQETALLSLGDLGDSKVITSITRFLTQEIRVKFVAEDDSVENVRRDLRWATVEALSKLDGNKVEAVEPLLEVLGDESLKSHEWRTIGMLAAEVLEQVGHPAILPLLNLIENNIKSDISNKIIQLRAINILKRIINKLEEM